jgi:hypothetical protein
MELRNKQLSSLSNHSSVLSQIYSPFFRVLTMNLSSFSITSLISHFSIFFVFLFHYSDDYLVECCIVHSA